MSLLRVIKQCARYGIVFSMTPKDGIFTEIKLEKGVNGKYFMEQYRYDSYHFLNHAQEVEIDFLISKMITNINNSINATQTNEQEKSSTTSLPSNKE